MSLDLELIRARNPIEALVSERFALRKSGTRFEGIEHDSLVVTPKTGFYFWNSRGEHGDAFDFAGRYLLDYGAAWNSRDPAMFVEAARCLAERAGLRLETPRPIFDSQRSGRSASWSLGCTRRW